MKFSIYSIDEPKKMDALKKEKKSFLQKEEDVTLFHYNQLNKNLTHMVCKLSDEYFTGTKKSGNHFNIPFSQYINVFLHKNHSNLLIEKISSAYRDEVKNYLAQKTNASFEELSLSKEQIINIVQKLNGYVKEVKLYDNNLEKQIEIAIKASELNSIDENYDLQYVLLMVDDRYISIENNGTIGVDNHDEEFLIHFTGEIVNVL